MWNRQSSSPLSERELVQCTDHMCPLRVHWHIKKNYRNYWRVKLTISNYNLGKNYSNWNVVVQHPGFSQQSTVFSFNNTVLPTVGVPGIIISCYKTIFLHIYTISIYNLNPFSYCMFAFLVLSFLTIDHLGLQ